MAIQTLEPHLVESLQNSAREILETMVFMTPDNIEVVPEIESSFKSEVVGLLWLHRHPLRQLRGPDHRAARAHHRSEDAHDEHQRTRQLLRSQDGFGELVNMLSGNFKNAWVANGNQMDLSVPNVIHNGEVRVNSKHEGSLRSCVRVTVEGQVLDVGIHFESKH